MRLADAASRPACLVALALFPLLAIAVGCTSELTSMDASCIAPANPGGGWDFTCRSAAQTLALAPGAARPMRVVNIPGDGGGVAYSRVVSTMRGSPLTIVAASPSTLLGLAQRHYGLSSERDVRWIAAVAAEPSVLAVRGNAKWRTLQDFITEWRSHPDSILIGGGSVVGGQDHMKVLLLARAAGIDVKHVRYVALSGPLEALGALRTGAIQLFPGDASEVGRLVSSGEVRVLAVLGEQRAPGALARVPTAREQGLDVQWVVWRGFYAPPGITEEAYRQWVERLREMSTTPAWRSVLDRNGLYPFFLGGADFERFVAAQTESYRAVSREIGVVQ